MLAAHRRRIETIAGKPFLRADFLPGGSNGEVWLLTFADGARLVAKTGGDGDSLAVEGWMLRWLADRTALPAPEVLDAAPDLLLLGYVPSRGDITPAVEADAADHLARLHSLTAPRFGFDRDTVIGPLPQPNPWTGDWATFLRDQRLMFMGRLALDAGHLSVPVMARLEHFCQRLADWISPAPVPALIHGDLWRGNLLPGDGRVAAFIDPALYYADAEMELAYILLFRTFGARFFARYREQRPVDAEFFTTRRRIYQLYPLLVHARLFGGAYGGQVDAILRYLGGPRAKNSGAGTPGC